MLVGKGEGIAEGHLLGGEPACKDPARWGLAGPWEAWWGEVMLEKERERESTMEREGMEAQRLEDQSCLGSIKEAYWRGGTQDTNVKVQRAKIISGNSELSQPPGSECRCWWKGMNNLVWIENRKKTG